MFPPLLLVISAAKLQIKADIEEQIRNKNVPKKSQSTEKNENNRKRQAPYNQLQISVFICTCLALIFISHLYFINLENLLTKLKFKLT